MIQTLPTSCKIAFSGLDDNGPSELKDLLIEFIYKYYTTLSKKLNLENLDAITLAIDYADAIKACNRGFETSNIAAPSQHGIGMALPIVKDGSIKFHIFLDVNIILSFLNEGDNETLEYLLTHEAAHVHDITATDKALPNIYLKKKYCRTDEIIRVGITDACWAEYAACRLSAPYSEKQLYEYEKWFCNSLTSARVKANEAIDRYRFHADIGLLLSEAGEEYSNLLKYSSYLLGHLAGLGKDITYSERAKDLLDNSFFEPFFLELDKLLTELWANYGNWQSYDDFGKIGFLGQDLIADGGIYFEPIDEENCYVHIP